jgi:hypothetical protein
MAARRLQMCASPPAGAAQPMRGDVDRAKYRAPCHRAPLDSTPDPIRRTRTGHAPDVPLKHPVDGLQVKSAGTHHRGIRRRRRGSRRHAFAFDQLAEHPPVRLDGRSGSCWRRRVGRPAVSARIARRHGADHHVLEPAELLKAVGFGRFGFRVNRSPISTIEAGWQVARRRQQRTAASTGTEGWHTAMT